jgi:NADPH2:quinone reductase
MKALRIHEYGDPLQLGEIESPSAGVGQVLVRNLATSLNPIDPGRASGIMRQMFGHCCEHWRGCYWLQGWR